MKYNIFKYVLYFSLKFTLALAKEMLNFFQVYM